MGDGPSSGLSLNSSREQSWKQPGIYASLTQVHAPMSSSFQWKKGRQIPLLTYIESHAHEDTVTSFSFDLHISSNHCFFRNVIML
jgi:hypothetical protein